MTKTEIAKLWKEAHAAGHAAATGATVTPMVVSQHADVFNDASPVKKQWVVESGVCGFAGIAVKGNSAFGRWAKAQGKARSHYPSGLYISVSDYGQSLTRKEAYAHAFAGVLNGAGVSAYSESRMD